MRFVQKRQYKSKQRNSSLQDRTHIKQHNLLINVENIPDYKIYPSALAIADVIAKEFANLSKSDTKKTIALSGGSTPKLLFSILASEYANSIEWTNLLFFWVDERCVSHASPESNYGVAKQLLFDKIMLPPENIFPVDGENEPADEAIRYAQLIEANCKIENKFPRFNLILLGMGTDGHTASIFPHEIELISAPTSCVVGTHPESGQKRISLSGSLINAAKKVLFIVTGADKSSLVFDIIKLKNNFETYPASRIIPETGTLTWLLDKEAGKLLTDENSKP